MRDLGMWTPKMWELYKADKSIIAQFQRNMEALRRLAGWSTQELADEIGVSHETILSLEKNLTHKMSDLQYMYLYTVLERRADSNELLRQAMPIILAVDKETAASSETKTALSDDLKKKLHGPTKVQPPQPPQHPIPPLHQLHLQHLQQSQHPQYPAAQHPQHPFFNHAMNEPGSPAFDAASGASGADIGLSSAFNSDFFAHDHASIHSVKKNKLLKQAVMKCPDCSHRMDLYEDHLLICPYCDMADRLHLLPSPAIFECIHCGSIMDYYGAFTGNVAICPICGAVDEIRHGPDSL